MAVISDKSWDNIKKDDKELLQDFYRQLSTSNPQKAEVMADIFGLYHLEPPKPFYTWDELNPEIPAHKAHMNFVNNLENMPMSDLFIGRRLRKKLVATYKIGVLIEEAYGGVITELEWRDYEPSGSCYYGAFCETNGNIVIRLIDESVIPEGDQRKFVAFHTLEDGQKFVFYDSNVQLLKDYYMVVDED